MIDPKIIRENPEKVKKNFIERYGDKRVSIIDEWLDIDKKRNDLQRGIESLNRKKNELSELWKTDPQKANEELQAAKLSGSLVYSADLTSGNPDEELKLLTDEWKLILNEIPNFHSDDVPIGKDDSQNVVLREVGDKPNFDFSAQDHLTLGTKLGILDFESGSKVAGSQFYYLKGDAVRLEFALIQYAIDYFTKKGFELVLTPDMAKSKYYLGTGYAPRGDEAQTYTIEGEDLGLIATAEVTMAGMHANEVLELTNPLKYAAISHCFRKEAGAYGKYSKGLYRVHQFSKFEMFVYCKPEESNSIHEELLNIEEEIAQSLGIPYRVLLMCSGDLGGMAAKKYDLEAWMPGRNDFGEITSTSNCTDYQARNLNIKFRNDKGELEFAHMLNGTAVVMSRFPIAIIENYQQSDGSIKIPEVLRAYMGGKEYIGR